MVEKSQGLAIQFPEIKIVHRVQPRENLSDRENPTDSIPVGNVLCLTTLRIINWI